MTLVAAACRRILLLVVVLGLAAVTLRAQPLPTPVGKVNDFASVLAPAQRDALEAQLADLERTTSAEVAVVTVSSLDGRTIEGYATELFNTWGIGKKGRDNGVLILVSVGDRTMRIEVGYGLEGVLPDGLAGAVIRETFRPRFRDDDYPGGILQGTTRIVEIVRKNETLTAAQRAALDKAAADAGKSWGLAAFLGIFVAIGAFMAGSGAGARVIVPLFFGLVFGGAALFMAAQTAPRGALWILGAVGLAVIWRGFTLGRKPGWQATLRGGKSGQSGGGWMVGGSGSGSSSGRSSSRSGGFGGGRSGGGGASGSW